MPPDDDAETVDPGNDGPGVTYLAQRLAVASEALDNARQRFNSATFGLNTATRGLGQAQKGYAAAWIQLRDHADQEFRSIPVDE